MSTLLMDCSARNELSISRELTRYLAEGLGESITDRDLGNTSFPSLSGQDLIDLHNGKRIDRPSLVRHHFFADQFIEELRSATSLVVGVPIYNFTVPAVLKQWVDYVLQPGVTFKYESGSAVGLCDNLRNVYIVTSSGGTPVGGEKDFASSYFSFVCKFIGARNIELIDAGGSKREREQIVVQARSRIDQILSNQRLVAIN
ncbi:NAD(P)H-dependent oxidoreductase [Alcanivorax sp.]|uniref:FMN-dependent NADH-azoreductase n=1 Tax=Alcanivorax sp. TaxID=1872427 RepID=UPI000C6BC7D1|nr:NAD(P)H-dependent oxidoreductase [Alcanivorax sp.]MBQ24837.1 ACP phosphodiesterase [Alcanivorax sp.]